MTAPILPRWSPPPQPADIPHILNRLPHGPAPGATHMKRNEDAREAYMTGYIDAMTAATAGLQSLSAESQLFIAKAIHKAAGDAWDRWEPF